MPTFAISVNAKVLGTYVVRKNVITVGRSRTNTVSIASKSVSRNHLRIELTNEGWSVSDLGSLNGTYVNDIRVTSAFLSENDKITVGAYVILFSPEPIHIPGEGDDLPAAVANEPEGSDTDVRLEGAAVSSDTTASTKSPEVEATPQYEAPQVPPFSSQFNTAEVVDTAIPRNTALGETGTFAVSRKDSSIIPEGGLLPIDEKIKLAIRENPLADETQIRTRLTQSDFGESKLSKQDLQARLKLLGLDSPLKRYHFFMHS